MKISRRAFALLTATAPVSSALGRTPLGGEIRLSLPWPIDTIDPHRVDDAGAMLFASLIADPLFALDGAGRAYPTLADGLPETSNGGVRVKLRPHLASARGRALDARDVVFAVERSRRLDGIAVLAGLSAPRRDPNDPLAVVFAGADPGKIAALLASPLVALVPRGFDARSPDGTGAFRAIVGARRVEFLRNPSAARGAAFLDRVVVTRTSSLADALRAFEVGDADIGWLGDGLHRPRAGAVPFDAGALGWIVLRTGRSAGAWGAPGVAQQLASAVPPARLAHLGLGAGRAALGETAWGGDPAELLVSEDSPHLVEVARVIADVMTRPGHEVTLAPRPRADLARRKGAGDFALMVDVVRKIGPSGPDTWVALATAADRRTAQKPPRLASHAPDVVTRTLPLGVIGELRASGSRLESLSPAGWDFGAAFKRP